MATMDPTEEEISQVIDFANLDFQHDRTMVIQALKNNNRNVESVVMQYFDNPTNFRQKFTNAWNETFFQGDRNGNDNHTGISFHVESLDPNDTIRVATPPRDAYASAAPSRPPSRSNNKSPLSRAVDWAADVSGEPKFQTHEEDEMQRALRQSAQEAGIDLHQQESGVLEPSPKGPYFGPATRNDYDVQEWAMVPIGRAAQSNKTALAPSMRKRTQGAPAFLVRGGASSSSGNHSLGSLLTILHEIPLARNILLQCGTSADSYGFNSEWWNGQQILPPHILAKLESGEAPSLEETEENYRPQFEEEIHRLMAFLDSTDRSHGSISVLSDLLPLSNFDAEKQFYENLGQHNQSKIAPMLQTASLVPFHGDDLGEETAMFCLLELEHPRAEYAIIKTLYEALDHLMWNDVLYWNTIHEESKMAVFTGLGEVIALKIGKDGPEESIEIPEELYPEKYLASRKEEARRIQKAWCETKLAFAKVSHNGQKLNEWRDDFGQIHYTKRETVEHAMEQWKTFNEYLDSSGRLKAMQNAGFDTNKYPDYRAAPIELDASEEGKSAKVREVLQVTEQILGEMDQTLKDLSLELEQIQAKQRFLGKLLTVPDKPGRPQPMTCKKYLLRGIGTDSDVTFLCQRHGQRDLIDLNDEPQPFDQWWKLSYIATDANPVKAEKITIEDALREVWKLTKTPLLVYATETAVTTDIAPLASPLERFVRADNKAFNQEQVQECNSKDEAEPENRGIMSIDPISPSKRKHRSDSMDSMDSNRASIGSDGRNTFDESFGDVPNSNIRHLAIGGLPSYTQRLEDAPSLDEPLTPPPVLPPRPPGFYEVDTSIRLTPDDSVTGEDTAAITADAFGLTTGDKATTAPGYPSITPGEVQKVPEMQERQGASIFAAKSNE